jgi:hypothetical protein
MRATAWVQKFVTPNYLGLRIGKKWERVTALAAEVLRNLLSVNADRNRQDSLCPEFRQIFLDAS